ncbi:MAG TPA: cobaltochelatase subunit CobN, partial [Pyrinomonadaceae bacterium]|nr:cobaltochelatase subunit CobN [Pyrinomonadaceae bacterium]
MSRPPRDKSSEARDRRVLELWEQVVEVERRLIPTGLHVFGRAADGRESEDLLRAVASYDRPEFGARALCDLVSEGLGLGAYERVLASKTEEGWRVRARVDEVVSGAVRVFLSEGADAACDSLEASARVPVEESRRVFALLARVREQLKT